MQCGHGLTADALFLSCCGRRCESLVKIVDWRGLKILGIHISLNCMMGSLFYDCLSVCPAIPMSGCHYAATHEIMSTITSRQKLWRRYDF